jgi:type I restriction enzyme, S subunit
VLRPRRDVVDPLYLYYAVSSARFVSALQSAQRGASYPAVSDADVLNQQIPLPPLLIQRSIATILATIHGGMVIQDEIIAELQDLKIATMAKLFREGVRGEALKHTEMGEIPESWAVSALGEVSSLSSGGTPPKDNPLHWAGPVSWLSPKDMKRTFISDTTDHISEAAAATFSRVVSADTIFVVVRGMVLAKDFPVALSSVPMAFNQDMKAIVPRDGIVAKFLLYALMARKDAIQREIGSSAHGTKRLGTASLSKLLVPVPHIDEQHSIAGVLGSLDRAEEIAKARQVLLAELFDCALSGLMSGDLDAKAVQQSAELLT